MGGKGKENQEETVIEVQWDFLQKNRERLDCDYINTPIKEVQEWVNGLPMSGEDRQSLMNLILEERAKVNQPQP